ncbi:MAG: CYTH domain-containing protein, partial [Gemmatimonadota bacterium]|nr:CYTH domain-containing protein [Gemmatimonadota bacterium]
MTNIEIKAHYPDVERAEENLNALGAGLAGTFHQKDTYFNVAQGRLKLRELGTDEGHLIFYHREDLTGPKRSDY